MLLILLALITAFAESPIAACAFRKRDGYLYVLLISALINLLTNLLLNGLCLPLLAGMTEKNSVITTPMCCAPSAPPTRSPCCATAKRCASTCPRVDRAC